MARSNNNKRSQNERQHLFCVADEDVEAARRVLVLLTQGEERVRQPGAMSDSRGPRLARALFTLTLKQRRIELLGSDFSAEAPFDMLVALYASEGADTIVTATKLTELAALPSATVSRWLDHLVSNGWVDRATVAEDARKSRLTLAPKSRRVLDQLFS